MTRDEAIIAAWNTPETVPAIALRLICSARTVRNVFDAAQADGRLPAGTRPHFAAACGHLKEDDAEIDFEAMIAEDFEAHLKREDEIEQHRRSANVASCDALLAALRRAHGSPENLVPDMIDTDRLVAARQRTERERVAKAAGLGHVSNYEVRG